MAVKIVYPFDPDNLEADQPPFIEDLIELLLQFPLAASRSFE